MSNDRKKRILIVEDEALTAEGISNDLKDAGYETNVQYRGEDALQVVESFKPDLIIMDIKLGRGMDGIQVAEIIKSRYDIPIVYLTAYLDKNTIEKAKYSSPYTYISKPYRITDLLAAIEAALYKHNSQQSLRKVVSESLYENLSEFESKLAGVDKRISKLESDFDIISNTINQINSGLENLKSVVSTCGVKLQSIESVVSDIIAQKFKDFFGDSKEHLVDHLYLKDHRDNFKSTVEMFKRAVVGLIVSGLGTLLVLGVNYWILKFPK